METIRLIVCVPTDVAIREGTGRSGTETVLLDAELLGMLDADERATLARSVVRRGPDDAYTLDGGAAYNKPLTLPTADTSAPAVVLAMRERFEADALYNAEREELARVGREADEKRALETQRESDKALCAVIAANKAPFRFRDADEKRAGRGVYVDGEHHSGRWSSLEFQYQHASAAGRSMYDAWLAEWETRVPAECERVRVEQLAMDAAAADEAKQNAERVAMWRQACAQYVIANVPEYERAAREGCNVESQARIHALAHMMERLAAAGEDVDVYRTKEQPAPTQHAYDVLDKVLAIIAAPPSIVANATAKIMRADVCSVRERSIWRTVVHVVVTFRDDTSNECAIYADANAMPVIRTDDDDDDE